MENLHAGHRQRMKDKFLHAEETGTLDTALEDHELLELLLYFALPRVNTNEQAHRLLAEFGSLRKLMQADFNALVRVPGIGAQTALLLRLMNTLFRRCIRHDDTQHPQFRVDSADALIPYVRRLYSMSYLTERVYLLLFSADGTHIADIAVSNGTQNGAVIDIQRCVQLAVVRGAHLAVLVHNHPVPDLTPSAEDITVTEKLRTALDSVGIVLWEHFVVTENGCTGILAQMSSDEG